MNHLGSFAPGALDIHSQSRAILWVAGARRFRAPPNFSEEHPQFQGDRLPRSKVSGLRSQVSGLRSQVSGLRSQVSGLRSQVSGLRS